MKTKIEDRTEVRTRFKCNYQPSSSKMALHCTDPTRAHQHLKDECDLNKIIKKHRSNGTLRELLKQDPAMYQDCSTVMEFREAMDVINLANYQFESLDAEVRKRFANDPANFLAFASDASNAEEMVRMGLMKPEAVKRVSDEKEAKRKKDFDAAVDAEIEKRKPKP